MNLKLRLTKLLMFLASILAGETIAILPSQAATLASSGTELLINQFSHPPLEVETRTYTNTVTFATNGAVTANADATATADFALNAPLTVFSNLSQSKTIGEGRSYSGLAQSLAEVSGYYFTIGSGETFSFDFLGFLGLQTSIDDLQNESASATGDTSFQLFDTTTGSLLGYFKVSGIATPGKSAFLDYDKSANITFAPNETSFNTVFEGHQESAAGFVKGKYSQYFANTTSLELTEFQANEVSVKAVPENSSILDILFFGLIGTGLGVRSKFNQKPWLASTQPASNA